MTRILCLILLVVSMTICWYAIFAGLGWLAMVTTGYVLHVPSYVPLALGLLVGVFYVLFTGRTTND